MLKLTACCILPRTSANYGFIPKTSQTTATLDALVLCSEPIALMTLVRCYPIGAIKMIDNGENDEKVISIPFGDPMFNSYRDISELPKHMFDEMVHFFRYTRRWKAETAVDEVIGSEEVRKIIKHTQERYNQFSESCGLRDGTSVPYGRTA